MKYELKRLVKDGFASRLHIGPCILKCQNRLSDLKTQWLDQTLI